MKYKIVGIGEIAEIAKVTPSAVVNWRHRHVDFPEPLVELAQGPIFDRDQVVGWLYENGKLQKPEVVMPMLVCPYGREEARCCVRDPQHGIIQGNTCLVCHHNIAEVLSDLIAQTAKQKDMNAHMVHILRSGLPLCAFTQALPKDWPDGHRWVSVEDTDAYTAGKVTCGECVTVMRMILLS